MADNSRYPNIGMMIGGAIGCFVGSAVGASFAFVALTAVGEWGPREAFYFVSIPGAFAAFIGGTIGRWIDQDYARTHAKEGTKGKAAADTKIPEQEPPTQRNTEGRDLS